MQEITKLLKGASHKVLEEIAEITGLTKTTFVPGEPYQSAYNEGIRSIGLRLISMSQQDLVEVTRQTYKNRKLKWKKEKQNLK